MNYVDPLGLYASDRAAGGRGAVVEFYEGEISINYRHRTVSQPEFGEVIPDSSTVTIHNQSYGEFRRGEYQVTITEPGTYSIPGELIKNYNEIIEKKAILEHQKIRGAINTVAALAEITSGILIGGSGLLSGDDTLPAAGAAWVGLGVQNLGFGINDLMNAMHGNEIKDPDGPFPSLYIDW